jgi:Helix-turn-helix domain/RodZ C-terminal domain
MDEIGSRLREARMRAKIDISEVEVSTKIRAKYLRALENEEWDLLPGDVYTRSFLRTYGEYLGLDTRQLIDDYKRRYEHPPDHELRPIAPLGRERERGPKGPLIPPWAAIVGVLVVVIVALYFVGIRSSPNSGSTTSSTTTTSSHHHPRHGTTPAHKPKPTLVKLQLIPTGQVYVCLVDGNGKTLIPGVIYDTGQTIPVKTAAKLLLTLGNNAVQMKVNGVTVPVAASSTAIGLELLPGSHHTLPPSAQPRCA